MHPRLAELSDYLHAQRAELLRAVDAIAPADRDRCPADKAWSVAQVLDHLSLVEAGVARVVTKLVADARVGAAPEESDTSSVLGRLDEYGFTDRSRARVTPEQVLPRENPSADAALESLARSRAAIEREIAAADGLELGALVFPHPSGAPFDLYQWLLFVGQHEARHAAQIREIGRRLVPA